MARGRYDPNAQPPLSADCRPAPSANATGFYDDAFYAPVDCDTPEPLVRDPNDPQVVGIPVLGYLSNIRGQVQPVYNLIPGFEHLLDPRGLSHHFVPASRVQESVTASEKARAKAQEKASKRGQTGGKVRKAKSDSTPTKARTTTEKKAKRLQTRSRKRPRGDAQVEEQDDDCNDEPTSPSHKIVNVPTESFYVGDPKGVKDYLSRRLAELGLKPLRDIGRVWVALVDPKRMQTCGKYTGKIPDQHPEETYPSWWPRHVAYKEPAHLPAEHLIPLLTQILMLHRFPTEEGKPRVNWVSKLRRAVSRLHEVAEPERFASSKDPKYNLTMKQRAVTEILPDLFDVAQSYEDHVAKYNLFEGSENNGEEVPLGKQHTWCPASKPPKAQAASSKRAIKRARYKSIDTEPMDDVEDDVDTDMDTASYTSDQRCDSPSSHASPREGSTRPATPASFGRQMSPTRAGYTTGVTISDPPLSFFHSMGGLGIASPGRIESTCGGSFSTQFSDEEPSLHNTHVYQTQPGWAEYIPMSSSELTQNLTQPSFDPAQGSMGTPMFPDHRGRPECLHMGTRNVEYPMGAVDAKHQMPLPPTGNKVQLRPAHPLMTPSVSMRSLSSPQTGACPNQCCQGFPAHM